MMQPSFDPNRASDDPLSIDWISIHSNVSTGPHVATTAGNSTSMLPPLLKPPVMPTNEDELYIQSLERRLDALKRKRPSVEANLPLHRDPTLYPDDHAIYQTKLEAEMEPLLIHSELIVIPALLELDPSLHPRHGSLAAPVIHKTESKEENIDDSESDEDSTSYGELDS